MRLFIIIQVNDMAYPNLLLKDKKTGIFFGGYIPGKIF